MYIKVNREKFEVQVEETVNLGSLISELKELLGKDWKKCKLIFKEEIHYIPYQPQPIEPYIPQPIYPIPDIVCSTSI